ncbi:beta-1,3-galactosyltransferase 5-like [Argopecten irradians]|uniref:beta-1,3-galactosyltransferase 5-like n=1 Tax=Argopecten irradians TaxID=31199 RepID=UPI00371CC051
MRLRKPRSQMMVVTTMMFILGNISLVFEMGLVNESYTNRKPITAGNTSAHASIFQHYPMDIDLANIVNQDALHNRSFFIQPINPYEYQYKHSPGPCNFRQTDDNRHSVLVVIKSHVLNTNQRLAIRHMWRDARDEHVRLVFLLAMSELQGEQWRVEKEVKLYRDIVQGAFIDNSDNLTYKVMMGLHWINNFCPQAQMLLFLDDDFYVHTIEMLEYLRQLSIQKDTYIGKVINSQRLHDVKTIRNNPGFRNYILKETPTHVNGGSYVMSQKTAHKFYTAFPYVKYFEMDDIYIGIISQKLSIRTQHDLHFDSSSPNALAYECSHHAPRLLKSECPLAGRRREYGPIRQAKVKVDTFWVRLKMLPKIMKSAVKNLGYTLYSSVMH